MSTAVRKEKRLHGGGVGPEMRSPVGLGREHSALTLICWHVGERIRKEVLKGQRAGCGEQIVSPLATQWVREYGQGFALRVRGAEYLAYLPDTQRPRKNRNGDKA